MEKIIDYIKATRKLRKIPQSDIAHLLNLSTGTYSDIERGRINLKADDLIKIANFLQISIEDNDSIIFSEEEKKTILTLAERIKNKEIEKEIRKSLNAKNQINIGTVSDNHGVIGTNIAPISSDKDPESD